MVLLEKKYVIFLESGSMVYGIDSKKQNLNTKKYKHFTGSVTNEKFIQKKNIADN